jgi:hypothetical protein
MRWVFSSLTEMCHLSLLKLNFRSRTQPEKNVVQEAEKKMLTHNVAAMPEFSE